MINVVALTGIHVLVSSEDVSNKPPLPPLGVARPNVSLALFK